VYIYLDTRSYYIMSKSTILIESATRQLLKEIGRKGQTYDQLIVQLINVATLQPSRELAA